jgi:hypothetical protein
MGIFADALAAAMKQCKTPRAIRIWVSSAVCDYDSYQGMALAMLLAQICICPLFIRFCVSLGSRLK